MPLRSARYCVFKVPPGLKIPPPILGLCFSVIHLMRACPAVEEQRVRAQGQSTKRLRTCRRGDREDREHDRDAGGRAAPHTADEVRGRWLANWSALTASEGAS